MCAPLAAALAAAVVIATTAPAHAFRAQNGLSVEPLAETRFTVPYRGGGSGAPAFWCAAGDYVIRGLGLGPTTPIWRLSEPPRRSGEGIAFGLSPQGAASRSGLIRLSARGPSLSAASARALCTAQIFRDDRG